jgi:hypothetical protein
MLAGKFPESLSASEIDSKEITMTTELAVPAALRR